LEEVATDCEFELGFLRNAHTRLCPMRYHKL